VETVLKVAQIAALLSIAALCLYLIVTLIRLRDVLTRLQTDLSDIAAKAGPVLDNLGIVTEKLKSITTKIDEQVGLVKGSLESLKRAADNIVMFEEQVQRQLEEPIYRMTSAFGAIVNRFASLFDRFRKEKTTPM
jgi:methyl-accepting chemotaxis protein